MLTRSSPRLLSCVVALLVVALGSVHIAWGGSKQASKGAKARPAGIAAEVVEEVDFDSFDQLMEWLKERIDVTEEPGAILGELRREMDPYSHGCIIPSATPNPISVTKPKAVKVVQIQYTITLGTSPCGNVLCMKIYFKQAWTSAPSGGAILIGPFPPQSASQVCQGNSTTAKGLLILTKAVPSGSYQIKFDANGAGEFSSVYITVTVQ